MKLPPLGQLRLPRRLTDGSALAAASGLVERTLRGVGLGDGLQLRQAADETRPDRATPGQFIEAQYTGEAGARPYKLYIPTRPMRPAAPLIVMLHGCTQSPDDFAAGTHMNAAAEAAGCFVAYPGQIASANSSRCWNWFNTSDQSRGAGEPALIAGITREVMARHPIDPRRVYVAGLSAGGAAAAIMGVNYPEMYAAIGVHSGLACGSAHDMASAFAAMRQGVDTLHARTGATVPAIVFHGDRDTTVHPSNADAVIRQVAPEGRLHQAVTEGQASGGHAWKRTVFTDEGGRDVMEQWVVEGAGHAWQGGDKAGSFTDPRGPDATAEMLRFFLLHSG
jgi:poly(hydroxyalkanoate) depolymerase family esterase